MKKFYIPQIDDDKEEKKEEQSVNNPRPVTRPKQENTSSYKRERFVSSYYGTNVKDEISITGAKYGNRGAQYDSFRDPKDRIRQDDYLDFITFQDPQKVSAREDLTEEERKTPSYLAKDPAYKDIMARPKQENPVEEEQTFFRAEDLDEPQVVTRVAEPITTQVVKPVYEADDLEDSPVNPEMDDLEIDFGEQKKFTSLDDDDEEEIEEIEEPQEEVKLAPPARESFKQKYVKEEAAPRKRTKYIAPPLSILKHSDIKPMSDNSGVQYQRQGIDETLAEFGIGGHVVNFTKGPAVTQFEVQLDPGVRVQSVKNIGQNIQAKIQAKNIRIQAPIPGKSTVGIEVPNQETEMVLFGDMLQDKSFLNDGKPLNVVIGLDLSGKPIYLDIAKAPHVLVGGMTGSGKSVCINCIISSILYKAHPDDVKFIMVDPKIIEFSNYEDIPHLAMPIITETKVAQMALKWSVEEMERRYQMLRPVHVKDIAEYNQVASRNLNLPHLPYIVIIIDELADLLGQSSSDTMAYIQRITQKGRAAGIHMILATQRPSVDVISGTIKNNVPIRIAFAVKDQVNSSIILDHAGAERLLGHGDMLYNNSVDEIRGQGAYVSGSETEEIADFIREQCDPNFIVNTDEMMQKEESQESLGVDEELFAAAARFVVEENSASINRLQKTFNLGFNKAQAIMESLEDLGVVSENLGSRARVVQVTMDQLEEILNNL